MPTVKRLLFVEIISDRGKRDKRDEKREREKEREGEDGD